ncbi:MAG: hypothetical protein CVU62_13320 [Deltaproteobacteria bacterium HGW-Deltaproteobacteria-2]|jgi:hypothetical protein|nr:MAG: hypothetical protein CVU62_13320 [Deltaproteobacteria bacterium HGW-Deltaproteobacteria-2]
MTTKFPTELLDKLFPIPTENRFYKDKDDHCSAHVDDRSKCVNFAPVLKTHGCCEYMLVTGECDFNE